MESYWGNVSPIGFRGVYDEAKRFGEAMTMAYHVQALSGESLTIYGDGSQTRSFCYVEDDPQVRCPDITVALDVLGWERGRCSPNKPW